MSDLQMDSNETIDVMECDNEIMKHRFTGFEPFIAVLSIIAMLPSNVFTGKLWWLRFGASYLVFLISYISSEIIKGQAVPLYSSAKKIALLDLLPNALFALSTLVLMAMGVAGYHQYGRPVSNFIQHTGALMLMLSLILAFRYRAVDVMLYMLSAIAFTSFTLGICQYGLMTFITYISGNYVDDSVRLYYELHDICLIMPLFACHYMFLGGNSKTNWIKAIVALLISFVGFKRIAIAAAVIIICACLLLKRRANQTLQRNTNKLLKVFLFVLPILWVYITSTDIFYNLCLKFDINSMNRNELYDYFSQFVSFNPLHLGLGEGFCVFRLHEIEATGMGFLRGILGVHNDFLRLFVEAGPLGFLIGLVYYVFYFSGKIGEQHGSHAEQIFLICCLYAFIIYCTDNTTYYLVFQCGLYLIISVNAYRLSKQCGLTAVIE